MNNADLNLNPLLNQGDLPDFNHIQPEHVVPAVREAIRLGKEQLASLEKIQNPTWQTFVLPLRNMPLGSTLCCLELKPGKGAQIARSAGASVQLLGRDGGYAIVRLRSGEMRKIHVDCRATFGEVSNSENNLRSLGKAGAARWRGVRPTVRGVVMNPVDHPHGGGEGKTAAGRDPVSPWGTPTKGYRTRRNKRTNNMIVRRRYSNKG